MSKQQWLDIAEVIDALRIVPRVVLFGYCWWTVHTVAVVLNWYMALPPTERTLESSGLAGAVVTAITGLASWALKVYVNTGRKWGQGLNDAQLDS